jgi:hypothetical protein
MGGFLEPPPDHRDSISRPVILGVGLVVALTAILVFLLRPTPKPASPPDPYIANIKISDLKMGEATNFVGAHFTYIEGNVTNSGDKTVTNATVHVVFRDSIGQVAQAEDVPLYILQTGGPYPDPVNLSKSPLAPSQAKPFRLTFEHVSDQWNQAYPEIKVASVSLR